MSDINTSNDNLKYAPKNIPIENIIDLALKNLTLEEMGSILNCDKSNISRRLNSIGFTRSRLEAFKDNRANIQTFIQALITERQINFLNSDAAKIEKWQQYRDAQISKATEQDKEQIIVNLKQDNSVNISQLIQTVQQYDKVLKEVSNEVIDDE